jgi:hypothetical protein
MNKLKHLETQFNQIFKDMGFNTYGDNTLINIFRLVFWSSIILALILFALEAMWFIDFLYPGIWK